MTLLGGGYVLRATVVGQTLSLAGPLVGDIFATGTFHTEGDLTTYFYKFEVVGNWFAIFNH